MRLCSLLAGKRKPRPGLGVAAFSPKQPAARRRRWRRAHFGTTGLKACPFAACLSFCERGLLFLRCLRRILIPCGGKGRIGLLVCVYVWLWGQAQIPPTKKVLTFRKSRAIIAPIATKAVKRRVRPSRSPQRVPAAEKGRIPDWRNMVSELRTDGSAPFIRAAGLDCDGVRPLKR